MPSEAIPGMAERVREMLRRRVDGDVEIVPQINELTIDQIYGQGPLDAIQRVVRAAPNDPADLNQWTEYRDEAQRSLGSKVINEWIKNLQKKYGLGAAK